MANLISGVNFKILIENFLLPRAKLRVEIYMTPTLNLVEFPLSLHKNVKDKIITSENQNPAKVLQRHDITIRHN